MSISTNKETAPSQLLDVLTSLNRIGTTINRIGSDEVASVEAALHLIVESAIQVVQGTSAVIYTYDQASQSFEPGSRVSAGETMPPVPWDRPRPNGMGHHAIRERRCVLSYEESAPDMHPIKVDAGAKAVTCFPLIVAEEIVGVLYVYIHEEGTFSELDLLLLENFVNQAAIAIYHARRIEAMQRDLTRREEEVVQLRRAGLLISSRTNLKETLETIVTMALEVTKAQYGNCLLLDQTGTELEVAAIAGERLSRPYIENIPIDRASVTGLVASQQKAIMIPDLHVEPWASVYLDFDEDLDMRSELAVPLISASGRLEGVLNLESPHVNAFSEQDKLLLEALATHTVVAIQEVILIDALKEITSCLLTRSHSEVFEQLVSYAINLLNGTAVAIWIHEDGQLLLESASSGYGPTEPIPVEGSFLGQAIQAGSVIMSPDVKVEAHFIHKRKALDHGWASALAAPIIVHETHQALGVFCVYGSDDRSNQVGDSDWDRKVITILSDYAALALISAAHQDELARTRAQHAAIETFAALGDVATNLLHQINNVVGTIPVRIQGIQDKSQQSLVHDSYLSYNLTAIEESAYETMRIVRDNMALLHPVQVLPVDIAPCVQEAINRAALPSSIAVELTDLLQLPQVIASSQTLTLVFANLLENAGRAMVGAGRIEIAGKTTPDWVDILVSDTGPGIDKESQGHIFEFSYSGDGTDRAGKLGFGLWWIRMLMSRLGGAITVESDGQHGTTFRLRFPRIVEEQMGDPL